MDVIDILSKILNLLVSYESQPEEIKSAVNAIPLVFILFSVLIWFISKQNIEWLLTYHEQRKRNKINVLNEMLSSQSCADDLHDIIKDLRDAHYFKEATNIYAEYFQRTALIDLYQRIDKKFTWEDIRRSLKYANFNTDVLTYQRFTRKHKMAYWFNIIMGLGSAIFSFLILILILTLYVTHNLTAISSVTLIFQMIFIFMIGLSYLRQNWSYNAAKRISRYLDEKLCLD